MDLGLGKRWLDGFGEEVVGYVAERARMVLGNPYCIGQSEWLWQRLDSNYNRRCWPLTPVGCWSRRRPL